MPRLLFIVLLFFAVDASAEGNNFVEIQRSAKCFKGMGSLPPGELEKLNKHGITDQNWNHDGINCFTGDFNGDGITDYVLAPFFALPVKNQTNYSHWKAAVIFMPAPGKEPTVTLISKDLYNSPDIYPRNHSKQEKEMLDSFGCPTTNPSDGIIEWGEGGTSYVFLWDKKKSDFVTYTCASE